jgi:hypothetical protein
LAAPNYTHTYMVKEVVLFLKPITKVVEELKSYRIITNHHYK